MRSSISTVKFVDPQFSKMDVSPSRNSTHSSNRVAGINAINLKDRTKSMPKLSGDHSPRSKKEAMSANESSSDPKPLSNDSKSTHPATKNMPNNAAAQTKIPMKRMPASNSTPNTALTPRSFQKQQATSKTSLTIKEIGSKNLNQNASKLSFKAKTSTNLKPGPGRNLNARGLTATSISRRSASNVSRGKKSEDLPKVASTSGDQESPNLSAHERVAENNKLKVFENLQKKLLEMQSDFMQKFESLKLTSPNKLNSEYKFITLVKNDECKLIIKDDYLQKMPKRLPAQSVNEFKDKIKMAVDGCLMSLMESLTLAQNTKNETERSLNLEETHNKLEAEQRQKLTELFDCLNNLCNAKDPEVESQIAKIQKEMQESKKIAQLAEKTVVELKNTHAQELEAAEKALKEKAEAEVLKRDTQLAEMTKKMKAFEKHHDKLKAQLYAEEGSPERADKSRLVEELKGCKENIQNLNKKLTQVEQQLGREKKEKNEKNDALLKLEAELEATKKKLEEQQCNMEKPGQGNLSREKEKEMQNLKKTVDTLKDEKQQLEWQIEKMQEELCSSAEVRVKLQECEERIRILQLEREQLSADRSENGKDFQPELSRLRQSESEKRREIEKLKVELSKAHFNICQLEEQIQRDQQLLEVRSELINSLQTNDNSQRIHLEEMFAQVGEKNNTINELNNELRTKSEEFRNLFKTLSTKQMELSRQEHMIKLLEESNERSQMLRVKQEEKIGRMEEEIAHLKQTIAIYQNSVLGNAGCKNLIYPPAAAPENYNENFYYYTSERRRKRQVDINVKKYEA